MTALPARILEPEVMESLEDAEDYDAMDFTDANTRFAVDALALVKDVAAPRVLDLGTGTARIPILMVERRAELQVLAVDLATSMLEVARRNVEARAMHDSIELARMDVKALPFPAATFDLVLSNSTAHHLPNPLELFREIARVVRPGGAVCIRDLVRPPTTRDAWAIVDRVSAGEGPRQRQLFFDSLCAALTIEEVCSLAQEAGLERLRIERVSDRHWTAERSAAPAPSRTG